MVSREKAEAEQVKQRSDVKIALKQASALDRPSHGANATKELLSIGTYGLFLLALAAIRYLLSLRVIHLATHFQPFLERLATAGIVLAVAVAVFHGIEIYLVARIAEPASRYNMNRIVKLVEVIVLAFIALSITFVNWYAAIVSIGLLSLILGFALQSPITSFIAWIYILIRTPFRVGDRIRIDDATGDVIDVSYLDTTLWEFGGQYLSTDHPSGRIIKFPNSKVLNSLVYNYSWPLFPYIWNEIKVYIAYDSDLGFVAEFMQKVVEEELGEEMEERVRVYREVLSQTPVDQLDVRERPSVVFRVSDNTFLEAIVRYLVHPKESGRVKNRLVKKLLSALNAYPDRVRFPKGDSR
jgi:small-conductance mechanosensitive channel